MSEASLIKISIVTAVYNAVETIENTLKSVINQSYPNIEFIIIDGGSTDGSLEVIARYKNDISILISEKDDGVYYAMNKGLKIANGDWIFFLGADDLLSAPTIIEELATCFTDKKSIYYGNAYIKTRNRLYNGKINKYSISLGNISHQAIFYPKNIYKTKSYDPSYKIFADHIYNIELYSSYQSGFVYLPKLISIYEGTGISSYVTDEKYHQFLIKVVIQNFGYFCGLYVWIRKEIYHLLKVIKR